MAQSWKIDPATGDYVVERGVPVETDSLQNPAYVRLKAHRTRWLYAPDTDWGSDFYALRTRLSSDTPAVTQTIAERALQPLIDDGRASEVPVEIADQTATAIGLKANIVDAQGEREDDIGIIPIGR